MLMHTNTNQSVYQKLYISFIQLTTFQWITHTRTHSIGIWFSVHISGLISYAAFSLHHLLSSFFHSISFPLSLTFFIYFDYVYHYQCVLIQMAPNTIYLLSRMPLQRCALLVYCDGNFIEHCCAQNQQISIVQPKLNVEKWKNARRKAWKIGITIQIISFTLHRNR